MSRPAFVGIDLGTTNSSAAVFDGEELVVVRNAAGSPLTPSVVRVDAKGQETVGARARAYLDRDPVGTRGEFKRVLGTGHAFDLGPAGRRTPEQLSAAVLRSLRADLAQHLGFAPARAVVGVPALFEVPQSAATAEAARQAGFERVELLQEPVASALASGWKAGDDPRPWLVYDLGGGTFDVSLLETREGLLRVVGHDGDAYLGGRDFDWALVDALLERLSTRLGRRVGRDSQPDQTALRRLKLAVEDARIELTRVDEAALVLQGPLVLGGAEVEEELSVDRALLERVGRPLVERSLAVCLRLLERHGLGPAQLGRLVLVGGPTWMPFLRARVSEVLRAPFAEHLDPMTLVAQGAALFAATAGLAASAPAPGRATGAPQGGPSESASGPAGVALWLHHPAMTSDLQPHVVGRLVDAREAGAGLSVRLTRVDGGWESPWQALDAEGAFVASVELRPRALSTFRIGLRRKDGTAVAASPGELQITHGLSMTDPPVARTIGVALADGGVHVYFQRGAPLPARRTFRHRTAQALVPGRAPGLDIPIVQGELLLAHLCRHIGSLTLDPATLQSTLPAGSEVELTLELDRGGRLTARALVPSTGQVFEDVVRLVGVDASPAALEASHEALRTRVAETRARALRDGATKQLQRLAELDEALVAIGPDLAAARGGDVDAAQRASRALLECDGELAALEEARQWPELEQEIAERLSVAARWVQELGTEPEQRLLAAAATALERAREERRAAEVQRQLRVVERLGTTAYLRHPQAWSWEFDWSASRADAASDLSRAQALVAQGRAAQARGDTAALRAVVADLRALLPAETETARKTHGSGVR